MKVPKICAVKGPAGEEELAGLITYAMKGWHIALMDLDKKKGEKLKQKLADEYNIIVKVITEKNCEEQKNYDIEGFFYHGNWDREEDVDIFWGFMEGKYGGIHHIIGN